MGSISPSAILGVILVPRQVSSMRSSSACPITFEVPILSPTPRSLGGQVLLGTVGSVC